MKNFLKKHIGLVILLVIILAFPASMSTQARLNMRIIITGLAIDKTESGYFVPGTEPAGWTLGMRYNLKKMKNRCGKNNPAYGKHFYNNGSIQVLAYECPEGFVKGMLKK